jgi:hypothetical protein
LKVQAEWRRSVNLSLLLRKAVGMTQYSHGTCAICKERHEFLMALHGDKGGPMCCLLCSGKWHAEHGRRRRLGRIVIRAMIAFMEGGGSISDIDKLKDAAIGRDSGFGDIMDPHGYLAGVASTKDEIIELTSELLNDTIQLVHPDHHPSERQDLAKRVSQKLIALKPFIFPAPKPKPPPPWSATACNESAVPQRRDTANPSRYPCVECAATTPYFYCATCRAEWDKRQKAERDAAAEKRREYRKHRKASRSSFCAVCSRSFFGKRRDALYCSDACRQQAHRKPSPKIVIARGRITRIRDDRAAKLTRHPITLRDDRMYIGENELKLQSDLEIVEGRLRFKSSKDDFRPGLAWNYISFVAHGRTRRLRLLMCEDCKGLFAGRNFAWLCAPCAKDHKDKATKARADRKTVTDRQAAHDNNTAHPLREMAEAAE